jgi:aspartate aminotransferase
VGNTNAARRAASNIHRIQLLTIGSPPAFGANIATTILSDPDLYDEWRHDVRMMYNRLVATRIAFVRALKTCGAPGDWSHISKQVR